MENRLRSLWILSAIVALVAGGCSDPQITTCRPLPEGCEVGSEGCSCTAGGACDAELACTRGRCEVVPEDPGTTSHASTANMDDTGELDLPDCMPPVYWRH